MIGMVSGINYVYVGEECMTQTELKEFLKDNERYKGFTILDKPIKFEDYFADKNIDVVQLHSIETYGDEHNKDVIGFCGVCKWKEGKIEALDGDSYTSQMTIYGYEWWSNEEEGIEKGIDILVGTDW